MGRTGRIGGIGRMGPSSLARLLERASAFARGALRRDRSARQARERRMGKASKACLLAAAAATAISAQAPKELDWKAVEDESIRQFQAVLRIDTRSPPGNEHLVAEYLKQVFDKEGIPAKILALDPNRSNVVARLKGKGRKRPLIIMGHSDVVTVDESKG